MMSRSFVPGRRFGLVITAVALGVAGASDQARAGSTTGGNRPGGQGGVASVPVAQPKMGDPLLGLTPAQLTRFNLGREQYVHVLTPGEGLGPCFNQNACGSCHNNPVGGTGSQTVTRFGFVDKGTFDPLANLGGSLPNDIFSEILELPTVWVPHSYPACSQHAPNEHLPVAIAREGLAMMAGLYWDLGEARVPGKA